jgi:cell division protein ZapE
MNPAADDDLLQMYRSELAARGFETDPAQEHAVRQLDALRRQIAAENGSPGWLPHWFRRWRPPAPQGHRGIYLWGGVGRGKTWLMDLFFDSLRLRHRRRSHFHHFMRDVHERLHTIHAHKAPLQWVARALAAQVRVLCLDELFVSDIADAMILGELFAGLLERGVILVITSNQPPQQLYRDGLQRARFLPAIALLQQRLQVAPVDNGVDYRLRELRRQPIYLVGPTAEAGPRLQALFDRLADAHAQAETALTIQGRRVQAVRRAGEVVWFSFATLCEGARSQYDYADIADEFHTVLLAGIPIFDRPEQDNAARRFIALVDEFYDRGTVLVAAAAAAPEALYRGERLQFEFQRTASRLIEMQTEGYLADARHRSSRAE